MQDSFLSIYPKLSAAIASASTGQNLQPSPINGLWLAHGDEPLVKQWLNDAVRTHWQAQNLALKHVDLVSIKSWQDVLTELNSLSLFDDASGIVVTGNHKPDKTVQAALEAFALEAGSGNNQNAVLWLTSKVDKRAQSSKWFTPFAKYGQVIDCNLYNENQRQQLLELHARRFGFLLTSEAWQFLMVQTEHYLLGAYQALWRLSYLLAPQLATTTPLTVHADVLQNALVSDAHYSVFDLSDAMLAGNAKQVVRIVEQLRATDEPMPLILWAVSKDMRLIIQLMDGQDPQSLGIWRNKQADYRQACQRQSPDTVSDWPTIIYDCDKAIKGLSNQPAWELILQAALRVAGIRLFHLA